MVLGLLAGPQTGKALETAPTDSGPHHIRFVRIATGPISGISFPIGGLIANALSNPPGSQPCNKGGSCGAPGLIVTAQSTDGALANVLALSSRQVDLALIQADIAVWASSATSLYAGTEKFSSLRSLAHLYNEHVHLVARKDSGISKVTDLKGKRVSLGREKSGTRIESIFILEAFGIHKKDINIISMPPDASADALSTGKIDAYFFVGGAPLPFISSALDNGTATLIPLEGPPLQKLLSRNPFLVEGEIPQGTYPGTGAIKTLHVPALLTTRSDVPASLITSILQALWHPTTQTLIHQGHPALADLRLDQAISEIEIPLHPAAETYYRNLGLLAQ